MENIVASTRAGWREWVQLAAVSLAVLLVAIDATVLNLAIPAITEDLQPSGSQMLWIIDIYSLVLAGLLVTAGTLADRYGRKRVLLIGCTIFAVASALAAFAASPELLIASRVLMAVGGATIMPSTLALIRSIFLDANQRRVAIGVWSAMAGAGAAVGPILGGFLLEHFWWGSVFLINIPVLLVLLVVGGFLLTEHKDPSPGKWDFLSAVLSTVGLLALVYAIKSLFEKLSVQGFVVAIVAIVSLVVFVRRQRILRDPMIDVGLFRNRSFTGAVSGNLFALVALAGMLLFLSQYLQLVYLYSPLEAGLRLLPLTIGMVVVAPCTAFLVRTLGARITISGGLLLGAISMVAFSLVVGSDNYLVVALVMVVLGAGVSVSLTASSDAIVSAAPAAKAGAASSISETAYELGTGLGIAVLGTVLAAQYRGLLLDAPAAARESLAAAQHVASELPTAEGERLLAEASDAFVAALSATSIISAVLLAAAAVITFTLIRSPQRASAPVPATTGAQ